MSKHKIIGLALCGLILTSCGNGGENTAAKTEIPETSAASESVSETTVSETETETKTEIPESSENVRLKTERIENFDKIKDIVISDNEESALTAGQYIETLGLCADFTELSPLYRLQLADISGDGIPDVLAVVGDFEQSTLEIFLVSESGSIERISAGGFCSFSPYEKDGKTVWIATITGGYTDGMAILRLSENTAEFEVICNSRLTEEGRFQYFWDGKELSNNLEYEKLRDDFLAGMDHSSELNPNVAYDFGEKTNLEILSEVMEKYISCMPQTYNEIKDTVLYSDEKNSLTAGQYIDALIKCRDFTDLYKNGIQLSDINGDGIPEAVARIAAFPITSYFSVSAEGEAFMLYDKNGESQIEAELPEPYEKDGKVIWLSEFYVGGSVSGGGGDSVLTYEDGMIKKEIIRCYDYSKDLNTFEYYYTYYWGSDGYWDDTQGAEVSKEEYESRYETLLAEMQPAERGRSVNRVYGGDTFRYYELKELLAEMLKECLEL